MPHLRLFTGKIQLTEFKPGTPIDEQEIARRFGVSTISIREAVQRLGREQLVTFAPRSGAVSRVNPIRTEEFCLIRLRGIINEQATTIEQGDLSGYIHADNDFHIAIVELSGYSTVADILQTMIVEIVRARCLSITIPGRLRATILEHRAILTALETGNSKLCSNAMQNHLELSNGSIANAMMMYPSAFGAG